MSDQKQALKEFEDVRKELEKLVDRRNLSLGHVMEIVKESMEFVDQYKFLDGDQKKELILDVTKLAVHNSDLGETEKRDIKQVLDVVAPVTIDLIILASKGGLNVNTLTSTCCGMFKKK